MKYLTVLLAITMLSGCVSYTPEEMERFTKGIIETAVGTAVGSAIDQTVRNKVGATVTCKGGSNQVKCKRS